MVTAVATPETSTSPAGTEQTSEESIPLEEIESEIDDRENSLPSYEILSYPADYTLEVLVDKYRKGQIVIPGFQRHFVWSQKQASKLIDSFLIGLPVPPIFVFSDLKSHKLRVVDGQQRLKSIAYFFEGYFGDEEAERRKVFRLTGLAEGSSFEGLTYEDLESKNPAAFAMLNNSVLRTFVVRQLDPADDTSIYHIFERLNTGGTQLSPQEIRNCVHHGPFNDMLIKANEYEPWRAIFGSPVPQKRQRDVELILRFFALKEGLQVYRRPMKNFLNIFMSSFSGIETRQLEAFERLFKCTADIVVKKLGNKPFHIRSGLNAAVFDSVFVAISQLEKIPADLQQRYNKLIRDEAYLDCVSAGTTEKNIIKRRIDLAYQALQ